MTRETHEARRRARAAEAAYSLYPESHPTLGQYARDARLALLEAKVRRMEVQQEGYVRLLERLTRERDAANTQAVAVSKAWANRAEEVERLKDQLQQETRRRGDARARAARLVDEVAQLTDRLQRTQEWLERWEGAASHQTLKRQEADLKVAELERQLLDLRTHPAGDREWMRQFAQTVYEELRLILRLEGLSIRSTSRSTLETLVSLARETRERGETADAAGSSPAGETHEGSTPSAPTRPVVRHCGQDFQHRVRRERRVGTFLCEKDRGHKGPHGIPRWDYLETDNLETGKP